MLSDDLPILSEYLPIIIHQEYGRYCQVGLTIDDPIFPFHPHLKVRSRTS